MLPVKVISLRRSTERRAEFARRNGHIAYEFIDAVDAMAMPRETILGTGLFAPGLAYTIGAHGAALSHLGLWQQAIASGRPLTVAEDDAIFRQDFAQTRDTLLQTIPPDWDMVLWGWNFDSILAMQCMPGVTNAMYFEFADLLADVSRFQAHTARPALFPLDKCFGLPAYTISPKGAQAFRDRCFPLTSYAVHFPLIGDVSNYGLDVAASRAYPDTRAFVCYPPLAVTRNDQSITTIQNTPHFEG
ncbi:MAG TPA: glycosyltransferase family 25 protein [Rhizomicrobium sp.]